MYVNATETKFWRNLSSLGPKTIGRHFSVWELWKKSLFLSQFLLFCHTICFVAIWEKLRKFLKNLQSFEQEESELELTHWVRQGQGWAWRMIRQQWAAWRMPSWTCSQLHRWSEKAQLLSFNSNQNKWWLMRLVMVRIWVVYNAMTKGDARLVKRVVKRVMQVVKRVGQRMRG